MDSRALQRLIARYVATDPPDSRRMFYTYEPLRYVRLDVAPPSFRKTLAGFLRRSQVPLALYVHVPYCPRRCLYCTCNATACSDRARVREVARLLLRELDLLAPTLAPAGAAGRIDTIHLGGGSPTILADGEFDRLAERLRALAAPHGPREFAVEVDPRAVDTSRLRRYHERGVNRLSVGVQDFEPRVLAAVGRTQARAAVEAVFSPEVRSLYPSIGMDLICGLPRQTVRTWARTLEHVLRLRPDRVAVNPLNVVPGQAAATILRRRGPLPGPAARVAMERLTVDTLVGGGYVRTGFDHFALPHDDLARAVRTRTLHRNLLGYTPGVWHDVVGVGPGANTELGPFRVKNEPLGPWSAALRGGRLPDHHGLLLSRDDLLRADVIHELLAWYRVDVPGLERRHGVRFREALAAELRALAGFAADGLVRLRGEELVVTARGRPFVLPICWAFARASG
ncbi:MAG: coproporphyrinogen dehydrogenase [Deltaproteobacteria bacterium]|nr:coproporphyrinogen dehydrogenase [Deltaproteobacteria bacterium]